MYIIVIFVMKVIPAVIGLYVLKFILYQNSCLSNFDRRTDNWISSDILKKLPYHTLRFLSVPAQKI